MSTAIMQGNRDGGGGESADDDSGGLSPPEDIILEVLVRLPARSLFRFRCVCKAWCAHISNPSFVAAQRSRATGPFIVAVLRSAQEHEVRLMDKGGNVLGAFDVRGGTALLAPTRLDRIFVDRAELGAMIIDPASGRHFTIVSPNNEPPGPPPVLWWPLTPTLTAVSSDYSFGRATVSGDYRVLRLVTSSYLGDHTQWCEVATIMDGGGATPTWRERQFGPFLDSCFSCENKATVNDILYFKSCIPYPQSRARDGIATFDIESKEWRPETIKCPPLECEEEDAWQISLAELKGTLCVVQNIRHGPSSLGGHCVSIWLLMDPSNSIWVKEYRIQIPGRCLVSTEPLDVLGDGTILLSNVSWKAGNVKSYFLQLYNCSTKEFTDYIELAHGFNGTTTLYTGSLHS